MNDNKVMALYSFVNRSSYNRDLKMFDVSNITRKIDFRFNQSVYQSMFMVHPSIYL